MVILFGSKRWWTFFETRRGTVLADRQAFMWKKMKCVWQHMDNPSTGYATLGGVSYLCAAPSSSCVRLYICCCHIWHTRTHVVSCCVMLCHVVSCCVMMCHVVNKQTWQRSTIWFHYRQLLSSHWHLRIHMYICMGWDLNTGIVSFPNMFPSEGEESGNETQPLHGCVSAVWTHTVGGRRGGYHRQQWPQRFINCCWCKASGSGLF